MNKVVLMGRLTRDPDMKYTDTSSVARFTLAVQRRFKREGDADADFINCVAFGRQAEFAEKYFRQGMKICISGRIQTGSYVNKDGVKVYTTDVVVEEQDFCESKSNGQQNSQEYTPATQYQSQSKTFNEPTPEPPKGGFGTGTSFYPPEGFEDLDGELPFR